jgi:putative heme-binding domain-containing protein
MNRKRLAQVIAAGWTLVGAVMWAEETPHAEQAELAAKIVQCASHPAALGELLDAWPEQAADAELLALIDVDRSWLQKEMPIEEDLAARLLRTLALAGDPRCLGYLHEVFETYPERRHLVAAALAQFAQTRRCRPEDWRLLVRSLMVVEGTHAREVARALLRFPHRATEPKWLRQVILIGLALDDEGAVDALALLEHWTGERPVASGNGSRATLANWQAWFSRKYPDAPDPELPHLPQAARWDYADLRAFAYSPAGLHGDAQRGAAVFEKAQCHKCHRFSTRGEPLGPNLSEIGGRLQRKELLQALLFPSERISDQYESYTLVTHDGRALTGMLGSLDAERLVVLQLNGEKITVRKADIEEAIKNKLSAMPSGLLEPLSREEIADLFAYLLPRRSDERGR